jgi:hypothetical protein
MVSRLLTTRFCAGTGSLQVPYAGGAKKKKRFWISLLTKIYGIKSCRFDAVIIHIKLLIVLQLKQWNITKHENPPEWTTHKPKPAGHEGEQPHQPMQVITTGTSADRRRNLKDDIVELQQAYYTRWHGWGETTRVRVTTRSRNPRRAANESIVAIVWHCATQKTIGNKMEFPRNDGNVTRGGDMWRHTRRALQSMAWVKKAVVRECIRYSVWRSTLNTMKLIEIVY